MTEQQIKDIHEVLLRIEKKIDSMLKVEGARVKVIEPKPKGSRKNDKPRRRVEAN